MTDTLSAAHATLLGRVDLFATLDRVALARLAAAAEPITFDVGEDVCREGDVADGLYVVVRGTFAVFATDPGSGHLGRIAAHVPGDVFGELALLGNERRTATVRAETGGEILRLERERFLELLKHEPSIAVAIAATLGRRLRQRDHVQLDDHEAISEVVDRVLGALPSTLRGQVLEASILVEPMPMYVRALFGANGDEVLVALETLSAQADGPSPEAVRAELRARFARSVGVAGVERAAEMASKRLLQAGHAEEALRILDQQGLRGDLALALATALERGLVPSSERQEHWLGRIAEDEAVLDPHLALAWSADQERRGARPKALGVLRRALRTERVVRDAALARSIAREIARIETAAPARLATAWRTWLAPGIAAVCVLVVGTRSVIGLSSPTESFAPLLLGAVVLWIANVVPSSAVGLGLVAAWILSGAATPDQAVAGFATLDWLFVLAVFAISAAVASSGLLFRVGLLLVRRLPAGLFWQSGSLLLTGVLLTPLLPTATGRAAITEPLALALADALRLKDRHPPAAVLGLAAWLGAGPLRFLFLNGSSVCLLAWGLLPDASRARFDWVHWLVGSLPLGIAASLGGLVMLFVALRPAPQAASTRGRVEVQLFVLGPPSRRELTMLAVLLLTVCGWVLAPALRMNVALIAVLGLVAAVATGNFGRQAMQTLDWDYLVFYGVALSLVRLGSALGLDRVIAAALGSGVGELGAFPLAMVLAIALLAVAVTQILGPDQSVLLLGLVLIPSAGAFGVDPWVVVVTVLAATGVWLIPSQVPMYMGAYSASEGRLFSPAQSRRAAVGYLAVLLLALSLSVPYWHLLGLL